MAWFVRRRPHPPPPVPAPAAPDRHIELGTAGVGSAAHSIRLSPDEVRRHLHIIGASGAGKSRFVAGLFVTYLNQQLSGAIIDPHGDLCDTVLALLLDTGFFEDERAFQRLRFVDFSERKPYLSYDAYPPMNLLDDAYHIHTMSQHVAQGFRRAFSSSTEGTMVLFETMLLSGLVVLGYNKLPITELPKLLMDEEFRGRLLARVPDPMILGYFRDRFPHFGRGNNLEAVHRRIQLLSFMPVIRASFASHDTVIPFRKLMDTGVSCLFNLAGLDAETRRFIASMLNIGFEAAALSRADVADHRRPQYHLFIDEFASLSSTSEAAFETMLEQTRKYHLYLTLIHQSWSQASTRLQGALQNAVDIAFRLGHDDAVWGGERFTRFDPRRIKHQIEDQDYARRSHPVFMSRAEQVHETADVFEALPRQEGYIRIDQRIERFRTLNVCTKASYEQLNALKVAYATRYLRQLREETPPPDNTTQFAREEFISDGGEPQDSLSKRGTISSNHKPP